MTNLADLEVRRKKACLVLLRLTPAHRPFSKIDFQLEELVV